jgi:hypothetical protein
MAFINRLQWIFISPNLVFADIKEGKVAWWEPWLWVSIILTVVGYFSLPIQRVVIRMNPSDLTAEQLEKQIELFERFGIFQLLVTPVVLLAVGAAVAGLAYILVSILSAKADFKRFFTLYFYGSVIASLTTVINVLVVRMKGVETLRAPEEAQFSIGLGFMAPTDGAVVKALFSGIEFFSIWSLVVIAMGLMHVFDMPRKHAIYSVIPLWLMSVIVLLIDNVTSGMN